MRMSTAEFETRFQALNQSDKTKAEFQRLEMMAEIVADLREAAANMTSIYPPALDKL